MLSFFRINDPYRLVGVFLILLAFRMPYWFAEVPMTLPQLNWILVGSRLSEGAVMYSEVWDNLSPLSAGFYWIVHSIFGNGVVVTQILSVLIVFFQSIIFNNIMIWRGALNENTYVPAVIYVILGSLYFDFFTLSPVMMGVTFILLALNNIFGQIEVRAKRDEKLLSTGIYLGVATLFHFPFFVFGPIILLVFILFTATVRRRYFLYLFGWVLPIILAALYYFLKDSFNFFIENHITSWFTIETKLYTTNQLTLLILGFVGFIVLISLIRIFQKARLTNYQSRLIQSVLFILILSGLILLIEVDRSPFVFFVFVPFCAFIISHFFTLAKRGLSAEVVFIVFILATGYINYQSIEKSSEEGLFDIHTYFVPEEKDEILEGKRMAWLGDSIASYRNTIAATPFLDWRLSKKVFEKSGSYRNLTIIAASFEKEKPEVIIDPDGLMPRFLEHAPRFKNKYRKEGQFYFRRPTNN